MTTQRSITLRQAHKIEAKLAELGQAAQEDLTNKLHPTVSVWSDTITDRIDPLKRELVASMTRAFDLLNARYALRELIRVANEAEDTAESINQLIGMRATLLANLMLLRQTKQAMATKMKDAEDYAYPQARAFQAREHTSSYGASTHVAVLAVDKDMLATVDETITTRQRLLEEVEDQLASLNLTRKILLTPALTDLLVANQLLV